MKRHGRNHPHGREESYEGELLDLVGSRVWQRDNYTFTLGPGSTGYQGQTVASYVGPDGICLNWGVSTTSPAVATAQPGTTCDPAAAPAAAGAAAWDPAPWVGAGAVLVGGTAIGLAVGLGSGSDHTHKTPPSTGQ